MIKGRNSKFNGISGISILLMLSAPLLFRVTKGEDCSRDGYYSIPRFGDSCQYRCRCVNEEQCERQTGSCQHGCARGWMGPGCQYRNIVIYNIGSEQSFASVIHPDHQSLATDGDKSTCIKAYSQSNNNPWWRIDFQIPFYIVGLLITLPETHNVKSFVVEGSDQATFQSRSICYQHDSSLLPNVLEIMCRNSLTVKHIRIIADTQAQSLEICEVEIYGGRYVSYKADTGHSSIFDHWNGVSSKAVDGRPMLEGDEQEEDAKRTCSVTGRGFNEYWNVTLFDDVLIEGLNVYGRRLPDTPILIGQISGFRVFRKPKGGTPHWLFSDKQLDTNWTYYQPLMIEKAPPVLGSSLFIWKYSNSFTHLSLCEVEIFAECKPRICGWNCTDICHCSSITTGSYRKNSICPYGCEPRWRGKDGRCDEVCPDNTWGDGCNNYCHCLNGEKCDFDLGVCPNGCSAGWKPMTSCNITCDTNTYGLDCSQACGNCKDNANCNATNGQCPGNCKPGWTGLLCKDPCADFYYGPGCMFKCGQCKDNVTCFKETGHCETGCSMGFALPLCTEAQPLEGPAESAVTDNVIVPVVIAIIVVIALIAVVMAILLRKRSSRRHKALNESQELDTIQEKGSIEGKHVTVDIKVGEVVVEDDTCEQVYVNSSALSEPIPISQLREYCHKVKLNPSSLFDDFKDLPHGIQFDTTEALKEENRSKNRYRDLYPYDKNVVRIPGKSGGPNTGYINASFIDGYSSKRRYIASQGAIKATVADVWRMVWTYDIAIIVMLTGCYEQGRHKCEQYWPEESSHQYDGIKVAVQQVDTYAEHTIRQFVLQKNRSTETKRVTQFHFTGWPDKDVPDDTLSLVQFWRIVKQSEKATTSPWMVHCSAGIGRTGTFIAFDYLHDQGQSEPYVDVKRCAHLLRDQRVNMVQTKDQYLFVHQAVNEALNPIGCSVYEDQFLQTWHKLQSVSKPTNDDNLYLEYKALSDDIEDFPEGNEYATFNTFLSSDDFSDSRVPENAEKSRDATVLPPDRYRPRLGVQVENRNDFINAVLISTFRKKDGLILSQIPLESTVVDCLRLIWQYNISTVVVMETVFPETTKYWDATGDSDKQTGPFTIQVVSEKCQNGITVRQFKLRYTDSADELSFRQFHFERWQDKSATPADTGSMLTLISDVEHWYRTSDSHSAILVQCLDGATRSGLFCVIWSVLERLKTGRTVAIAEAVRLARVRRKQLIPTYEQYRYCWTALNDYLEGTEVYGNIV